MFTIWGQILKKIHIKKLYNGFMVLGGVKSIGIINFAKIFTIVLVDFL